MASRVVEFRSDTLTLPTDEMREAMRTAEVGDDVYGEDPTINRLQEVAAKKVGMEAALFVPTGTMGNEVAVFAHTKRQGEILVEEQSHIVLYESGGPAVLSGVSTRTIKGTRGVFTPAQVEAAVRDPSDPHEAPTSMIGIENTHNVAGGTVWTPAQTDAIAKVATARRIPLHLDGARIFNSAVAQAVPVTTLTKHVDSVMFCLSKGLSAPVGSMLCGSKSFIDQAHRVRKLFGGGMRQAGHLAAAGLVALEKMVPRLADDHANARRLAAGLAGFHGLAIDLDAVQTNIVFVDVSQTRIPGKQFEKTLLERGVKALALDDRRIRFVTHRNVDRAGVDYALEQVEAMLSRKPMASKRRSR